MDQEDLTASHWDDVLAPSSTTFGSNIFAETENGFHDPHQVDRHDTTDDEIKEDTRSDPESHSADPPLVAGLTDLHVGGFNDAEAAQLAELAKEERKEHKLNLLSELTEGADSNPVAIPQSPGLASRSKSLFKETTSPLKVPQGESTTTDGGAAASHVEPIKSKMFTRYRRYNSKTIVENLNNSNPLGPLGLEPTADTVANANVRDELVRQIDSPLFKAPSHKADSGRLDATGLTPAVNGAGQASKSPTSATALSRAYDSRLEITVGDPMKVGDITTAHIVYTILVKSKDPDHPVVAALLPEPVTRRYRDFRWIYHQLQNNHPGIIVPPPPTKQTYIGRFNENFIEGRRLSLEKMLTKISSLVNLGNDPDFIMFLTSQNFAADLKERERLSGSDASNQNDDSLDNLAGEQDISSSIFEDPSARSGSGAGFMSSLFSLSSKINEPDDVIKDKKTYIEGLEHNLRNFYKSLELIGSQRSEIVVLVEEIATLTEELAAIEILKRTTDLLLEFSEIHIKLKENLDRTNLQDQLTLGFTIEEYLRIIGSIKAIFSTRLKIYHKYQTCEQELVKKQALLDKFARKNKSQTDKINLLQFEIDKLEAKTAKFKSQFNSITETITGELERFEYEKIDDFRNSVEIFIEGSIESQKEAIELWETFYQRQGLEHV